MTENHLCATVSVRGVVLGPHERVLVVQRTTDGAWELPGGRLASGEQPRDGLIRELREETGLSVSVGTLCHANSWVNDDGCDRFGVYYACESASTAISLSDEHTDFRWASPPLSVVCDPQQRAVRRVIRDAKPTPVAKREP